MERVERAERAEEGRRGVEVGRGGRRLRSLCGPRSLSHFGEVVYSHFPDWVDYSHFGLGGEWGEGGGWRGWRQDGRVGWRSGGEIVD